MKKLIFITILWLGMVFQLIGQTSASGESGTFTMDTENPWIVLLSPNGGENYSFLSALPVTWMAADSSFGATPVSVGFSTDPSGTVTWMVQNIPNNGSLSVDPPDVPTSFAKAHVKAVDAFGNESVDMSNAYFSLTGLEADFAGTPTSGNSPLQVTFTDLSTGSPTSWSWDFGDGQTSSAQNPVHVYTNAGVYTVSLTVSLNGFSASLNKPDYIQVLNPQPLMVVDPTSINFGNVPVYDMETAFFSISNLGDAPLVISSISSTDPFFASFSGTIMPGMMQPVEVNFAPAAALFYQSSLVIHSNVGDYLLPVSGTGLPLQACWQFSLPSWDFGLVDIPTGATKDVAVYNCGSQPLFVTSLVTGDEVFEVNPSGFTLGAYQTQYVQISFTPQEITAYSGVLHFSSEAGDYEILLQGNGFYQSTPPVLTFSEMVPFGGTTGVAPAIGPPGTYFEYQVVYTDADNDPPMDFYPQAGIDFNGDGDFLDPGESQYFMMELDPSDFDYTDGKDYSVIVALPENMLLGYQFVAWDNLGNPALGEGSVYHAGPEVSDDLLDLAIYANYITFSNGFPEPGDDIAISAKISNTSDYLAENVPVNVYIDNVQAYQTIIPVIYPQSSTTISFNHIFPIADYYPVKVVIDEENMILEDNELNNFAIRPVEVGDITLPGIIAVTGNIAPYQVYPNGTLRFYGHASYETSKFKGSPVCGAQVLLTILETGATFQGYTNSSGDYNIYFTAPGVAGCYTAKVEITDFTLTGNSATLPFCVIPYYQPKPDLVIQNQNIIWTGDPVINTGNTISANVYNAGSQVAENVLVYAYADGIKCFETTVPILNIGGSQEISFSQQFTTVGNHTVSIIADPLHAVDELSESNNTAFATRYIYPPEPDLSPVDITFSDNSPLTVQEFSITAWVKNLTWNPTTPTTVAFYEGENHLLGIVPLAPVSGGQIKTATLGGQLFNVSGWHTIKVVVDPENTVVEYNEQNQVATESIYIEPAMPDLRLSEIIPSNYDPQGDDPVNFTTTISNNGSDLAQNFYVDFRIDGSLIGTPLFINSLGIGESITLTSESTLPGEIPHQVCVTVDEANTVAELNEYNNQRCQTFGVDFSPSVYPYYPYNHEGRLVYILVNEPVDLFSRIYNHGVFTGHDVAVSWILNSNVLATETVSIINGGSYAGSSVNVQFTETGYFTVQIVADPLDEIPETNETNNITELFVHVYENLPDLYIDESMIILSNFNPEQNELIDVTASWMNRGLVAAGPFKVRLYIDQILKGETTVTGAQPGETGSYTWPQVFSSYEIGLHSVKIVVDSDDAVAEYNETNNVGIRNFVVGAAPDFDISTLTVSGNDPLPGDIMDISATIVNSGGAVASAHVNFYCQTYNQTIPIGTELISLPKNGTTELLISWIVPVEAGYIVAEITGSNPPEANLLNNTEQTFFGGELFIAFPIADVIENEDTPPVEIAALDQVFKNVDASPLTFTTWSSTPNIGFQIAPGDKLIMTVTENWNGTATGIITAHNVYGQVARDTFEILVNPMPDYPDLTPLEITFSDNTPFAGYPFDVQVKVKNLNWETSGITTIGIFDNGINLIGTATLPAIGSGQSIWVTITGINVPDFGWHTLTARVDPENIILETNETNQEISKNILVRQPLPDLSAYGISASDYLPHPGDPMTFMATVSNNGNAAAGGFLVKFTINGNPVGDPVWVSNLAIDESLVVTSGIWIMEQGPQNVCVTIDESNEVPELNEQNNQKCRMFGVDLQPSKSPYYAGNTASHRLNIPKGQALQLFATVYNNGTFRADLPKVSFVLNNEVLETDVISFINGGSQAEATVLHTFHQTGNFILQIITDFDEELAETNENNNVTNLYISVYSDLPDLFVASENIAPGSINPDVNESIDINATYFNLGDVYSGPFKVSLYMDDIFLKDTVVESVEPGEEASVGWPDVFSTDIFGIHIIKVVLDENSQVAEVNELNNVATRAIIVGDAPDMLLADISMSNFTPSPGELTNITISVENTGSDDANALLTVYFVAMNDTTQIHAESFYLQRYSGTEIIFAWSALMQQGTIYAVITGCEPAEVNFENNALAFGFGGEIQLINPISDVEIYIDSPPVIVANLLNVFSNVDQTAMNFVAQYDENSIGIMVNAENQLILTPAPGWTGTVEVIITAGNIYGQSVSDTFNVSVVPYPASHSIQIPAGWSGLSSWVLPHDPAVENVFVPIQNQLIILQTFDAIYFPSQFINTIGNWESLDAFEIKVAESCSLSINGFEEMNKTFVLNPGWNLTPVIADQPVDPVQVFSPLQGILKIAKDVAGTGIYWPEYGINTLGSLWPGKAYFVKMNFPGIIQFPPNEPGKFKTAGLPAVNFAESPWGTIQQNPASHLIAIPADAISGLEEDIFVGAFTTEGICAGACQLHKGRGQVLVVNADDPSTPGKDGFAEGEPLEFRIRDNKSGKEISLKTSFDPTQPDHLGVFASNGISAWLKAELNLNQHETSQKTLCIFPNPTQGTIHISGVDEGYALTVTMFNQSGQQVFQTTLNAAYELDLNNLPAGMYFVKMENQHGISYEKLVVE